MRGSAAVTYEAVKRQLELLGHNVPDAAIRAYLADLQQKNSNEEPTTRPTSQLSGCSEAVHARAPERHEKGLDDLCDRFESTLRPRQVPENSYSASRQHDSCSTSSKNPQATGPLVSEEVMTRAQTILSEHHHTHGLPRHEVPASERLRSRFQSHISGTLQPRASTHHPDLDEPPANIAPDGLDSRYNHPHTDPYHACPSTARPSRRLPPDSYYGSTERPQVGAHPRFRPATVGEAAQNTWLDEDFECEYEYGGDSADQMHDYHAQEPPLRGKERSSRMHAQLHRHAHLAGKNASFPDLPDEEYEEYMRRSHHDSAGWRQNTKHSTVRMENEHMHGAKRVQGRAAGVKPGSSRVKMPHAKEAPRHRDLSPFDATVEDHDREWENVLLEATGGAEVGQRAGQHRSGAGEAPLGPKGANDGYGEAWGFRDEWGEQGTERTYSQVHYPQQQRPRSPLMANNSYIIGRSNLSGAARPIDRVARFQQLQRGWKQDRFLNKAKGQPLGYQEAFERSHRREKVDLQLLKESNKAQRPATTSSTAGQFQPPGTKKREKLRWTVRKRMSWQD